MAIMVIETNSSFSLVESNAFRTLMAYCNGGAITISRRTLKRDIQSILYTDYYPSGNSLHNYARGICHHKGEHISEPKLPE